MKRRLEAAWPRRAILAGFIGVGFLMSVASAVAEESGPTAAPPIPPQTPAPRQIVEPSTGRALPASFFQLEGPASGQASSVPISPTTTQSPLAQEVEIYPPPIYNVFDDVFHDAFFSPDCGNVPGQYAPGIYRPPPSCGNGSSCECWQLFPPWYYQDSLGGSFYGCSTYRGISIADWPFTFGTLEDTSIDSGAPQLPSFFARFAPIYGFECLKTVPLKCTPSVRPVVAAARYAVGIGGSTSPTQGSYAGALFVLSAYYDQTLFDVYVNGGVLTQGSPCPYEFRREQLPSLQSIVFQDETPLCGPTTMRFRQSEWRTVPDYIDVRLKDGRIPSEADGQAVVLLLHTLNWAGDGAVCDTGTTVAHGDRISFLETDRVEIAFCSDEGIEDWYISPPALENQCQCPNISSARQNEAETEAIGARVVNELSADLPQVQSGHTNAQFRKTLDRTFANYAEFDFIYAPYGYLKVNILGEWVA